MRPISTSPGPGDRVGRFLVPEDLGPSVLVDPHGFHGAILSRLNSFILVFRVLPCGRHDDRGARPPRGGARDRRRRGSGRPAVRRDRAPDPGTPLPRPLRRTCASRWPSPRSRVTPRRCFPGRARSSRQRSATTRPARSRRPGRAGCRATRGRTAMPSCARSSTRSAERLGGSYRVLVDENQHVDREGAARAGVGFYGKNTMLITRKHGSWVVLGTLVTDVEVESGAPLEPRLRLLHALHRGLPDRGPRRARRRRRDEMPLLLDAGA